MSASWAQVDFDMREINSAIDRGIKAGRDLRPVFKEIGHELRRDIKQHFERNQGPLGQWEQLAASTQEKRVSATGGKSPSGLDRIYFSKGRKQARKAFTAKGKLKGKALKNIHNLLGRLKTAIKFTSTRQYLEARSRVKWSSVHEQGGTAGHGSHIPARPFMYASVEFLANAKERIILHISGALDKPVVEWRGIPL